MPTTKRKRAPVKKKPVRAVAKGKLNLDKPEEKTVIMGVILVFV